MISLKRLLISGPDRFAEFCTNQSSFEEMNVKMSQNIMIILVCEAYWLLANYSNNNKLYF